MRRSIAMISVLMLMAGLALAVNPTSMEQAKGMADRQNKPILLDFFEPDCGVCQIAAHDFASNDTALAALKSVVYLPLDINSTEGERLLSSFYVENIYPVFALTDGSGEIINRWTGYTNATSFMQTLNGALSAPITIKARYERLRSKAELDDVIFLAKYNNEIGDNARSAELYRQAQEMRNSKVYVFDIFRNTADAVWKGMLDFDQLIPAADDVLVVQAGDVTEIAGMARMMDNVGRKAGRIPDVIKYIQAGINITNDLNDYKSKEWNSILSADRALYVEHDTLKATATEKGWLGPGWEKRPGRCYSYINWCLDRKINLAEAENLANQMLAPIPDGKAKAPILSTLANIYEARGKIAEAAGTMEKAAKQDPSNAQYSSDAKRLRTLTNGKE